MAAPVDSAAAARRDLEHALAAQTEVTALAGAAERAAAAAEARGKAAAQGVVLPRVSELRTEVNALAGQLTRPGDSCLCLRGP